MSSLIELVWWGSSAVSIRHGGRALIIDPFLTADHPVDYDWVLVSREDHDHMHAASLRRLVGADRFVHAYVASGCVQAASFDVPNHPPAEQLEFVPEGRLTVVHPLHRKRGGAPQAGTTARFELDGIDVEVTEASERDSSSMLHMRVFGKQFRPADGVTWPAGYGDIAYQAAPTVGFFVEVEGVGIWHPGGLQVAYDALEELRGRVDVMLLPLAAMHGAELPIIDIVQPRSVVPIQYRSEPSLLPPVETGAVTAVDVHRGYPLDGADPDVYRHEMRELIAAGWHRSIPEAEKRIKDLTVLLDRRGIELRRMRPGVAMTVEGVMS
jgi:L-ascorbate metabolism protein UlaG (beta-lactamase superfamily)